MAIQITGEKTEKVVETPKKADAPKMESAKVEEKFISMDEFKKLKEKQVELEALLRTMNFHPVDTMLTKDQEFIPKAVSQDDLLDRAHVFFQFSAGGGIYGYTVNSVAKIPPYGRPILFKLANRFKRTKPKGGEELICISRAIVFTKSEKEYVMGHPFYGATIFDNMVDAAKLDTKLLEFTQYTANEFTNMKADRMLARAKVEGIPITESLEDVKKALIQKVAGDRYRLHKATRVSEVEMMSGKKRVSSVAFEGQHEKINPLESY